MEDDRDGLGKTALKWCHAADKARRVKLGTLSPRSCFSLFLGKPKQSCSPASTRQFLLSLWGCLYITHVLVGAEPIQSTDVTPAPGNKILPILLIQETCNACKMSLVFSRIEQYFYHLLLLFSSSTFSFHWIFLCQSPSQSTLSGILHCVQQLLISTSTCQNCCSDSREMSKDSASSSSISYSKQL